MPVAQTLLGKDLPKSLAFPLNCILPNGVKAAGMVRNAEMAKCSDALIAFWDGESSGTRHMINFARKRGLDISIIDLNQPRSQITDVKPSMENEGNEHIGESIPNNHQYKR